MELSFWHVRAGAVGVAGTGGALAPLRALPLLGNAQNPGGVRGQQPVSQPTDVLCSIWTVYLVLELFSGRQRRRRLVPSGSPAAVLPEHGQAAAGAPVGSADGTWGLRARRALRGWSSASPAGRGSARA